MVCVYCAIRADFVFTVLVNHSFKVLIKVFYTVVEGRGVGILPYALWVGSVTSASFRMSSFLVITLPLIYMEVTVLNPCVLHPLEMLNP